MKRVPAILFALALSVLVAGVLSPAPAWAQKPKHPLTKILKLEGQGGVTFKTPAWKKVRHDKQVAVFEHVPEGNQGFAILMMAAEPGPKSAAKVDWDKIRDNIVSAAAKANAEFKLEPKGDFDGLAGFNGQRLSGTLKSDKQTLVVEMLAFVSDGIMITVSVLSAQADPDANNLLEAVSKTTQRGS